MTITVICDSCRKTGSAGTGDFAHLGAFISSVSQTDPQIKALLEFTPVPRQGNRVDGWSAEKQIAFIAALATTGSTRRAAKALDMSPYGIVKLREAKGADSFNSAFDRAMAIAARNDSLKVAQGVADAAARNTFLGNGRGQQARNGHEADDDAFGMPEDEKLSLLENLVYKFLRKVHAEREARLAGQIVAADFYLRQVTFLEVAFDMMSEGLGLDGWQILGDLRRGGHHVTEIAETPMSRSLDDKRRELWKAMSEPERPEHPPERYLSDHEDHSTEPLEYMRGGDESEREEQRAEYAQRHASHAEAQANWERESTENRATDGAADALTYSRDAKPVRPACGEADTFDVTNSVRDGPPSPTHPDTIEYLSSLESEEDILAALMRDADSEDD